MHCPQSILLRLEMQPASHKPRPQEGVSAQRVTFSPFIQGSVSRSLGSEAESPGGRLRLRQSVLQRSGLTRYQCHLDPSLPRDLNPPAGPWPALPACWIFPVLWCSHAGPGVRWHSPSSASTSLRIFTYIRGVMAVFISQGC